MNPGHVTFEHIKTLCQSTLPQISPPSENLPSTDITTSLFPKVKATYYVQQLAWGFYYPSIICNHRVPVNTENHLSELAQFTICDDHSNGEHPRLDLREWDETNKLMVWGGSNEQVTMGGIGEGANCGMG